MIEFKTKLNGETLKAVNDVQFNNSKKLINTITTILFLLGFVFVGLTYFEWNAGEDYYSVLGASIFCFAFGFMYKPILKKASRKAQTDANKSMSLISNETEVVYKFDEDKVYIFTTRGIKYRAAIEADYDYFYKVTETEESFIMYISKIQCHIVNKKDIVKGTLEEFEVLLEKKLPAEKIEKLK